LDLIKVIPNQNYFQYNVKYFKPTKGLAVVSPVSSTLAEIYLQFFEELIIKQWIESVEISYYKIYVEDILIFDQNKTNENSITNHMNNMHKYW
jgi:hypothetical protein